MILSLSPSSLTKKLDSVLGKINAFYDPNKYHFTRIAALLLCIDMSWIYSKKNEHDVDIVLNIIFK